VQLNTKLITQVPVYTIDSTYDSLREYLCYVPQTYSLFTEREYKLDYFVKGKLLLVKKKLKSVA
jgi:hypothetical protein